MLHSLSKMFFGFSMLLQVVHFFSSTVGFRIVCLSRFGYPFSCVWIPSCFQCLAVMNKAAVNILNRSFYGYVLSFLLGKYTGKEGLAGSKSNVWCFKKLPDLFPERLYCFAFPPIMYDSSIFSAFSSALSFVSWFSKIVYVQVTQSDDLIHIYLVNLLLWSS